MSSSSEPDESLEVTESLRVPVARVGAGEGGMVWVAVNLTIRGAVFKTRVGVPKGPTTVRQLLPVLRGFSEAIVHTAVQVAERAGRVSCKAGCGACCRQLVPISQTEAYMLAKLVAGMPEPRRGKVLGRFAVAREKLNAAGLLEQVEHLPPPMSDPKCTLAMAYFREQIACPFLEEESCSIYTERPLVCREYLVSNDPKFCANPSREVIRTVAVPGAMSGAVAKAVGSGEQVALILALEWAVAHAEAMGTRPGPEVLRQVLSLLAGTEREEGSGASGDSAQEERGGMGAGF